MKRLNKHSKRRGAQPTKVLFSIEILSICDLLPALSSIGDDAMLSVCFERWKSLPSVACRNDYQIISLIWIYDCPIYHIISTFPTLSTHWQRWKDVLLYRDTIQQLAQKWRYTDSKTDSVISCYALSRGVWRVSRKNSETHSPAVKGEFCLWIFENCLVSKNKCAIFLLFF